MIPVSVVSVFCGIMLAWHALRRVFYQELAAAVFILSGGAFTLLYLFVFKTAPDRLVFFNALCTSVGVLALDLNAVTGGFDRVWPVFVLIADVLILLRTPKWSTNSLLVFVAAWIVAMQIQMKARFAFLEVGRASEESRHKYCKCDDPPCAANATVLSVVEKVIIPLCIFILDFFMTRNFAEMVLSQKAKAEAAIAEVQNIARAIAVLDLSEAGASLQNEASDLDGTMREELLSIIHLLEGFRPYVPDGLVEECMDSREADPGSPLRRVSPCSHKHGSSAPPAARDGADAAVVFTDIRSSTMIWENSADVMKRALRVHNEAVRDCIMAANGYEVKTIGDSFMIAFSDAASAVRFAIATQQALLRAQWPPMLLQIPLCAADSTGLWGGLTVRIGVEYGPVTAEANPLSSRMDYFGHCVNTAARVEAACPPGMVAVTDRVLEELGGLPKGERRLSVQGVECTVDSMGPVKLRGVSEEAVLHTMLPQDLEGRRVFPALDLPIVAFDDRSISRSESSSRSSSKFLVAAAASVMDSSAAMHVACATVGTVTQVAQSGTASGLNDFLQGAIMRLECSEGRVVSVYGSSLLVSWNAAYKCENHVENALRFGAHVDATCTVGLSTGKVLYGRVGTRTQRFLTVAGYAVTASELLCRLAKEVSRRCCFASCIDSNTAEAKALVESWDRREARLVPLQHVAAEHLGYQVYAVENVL